jgi:peptidyl-tRNA hydrolase
LTDERTWINYIACKAHINPSLTHYVIVRNDLPIGFLTAQIVHAAGESAPGNLKSGTHAVVLAVRSESALLLLERQFQRAGVKHVAIREPDPPYNGALTAIGLAPVADRSIVRKLVSRLPLFAREKRLGAAV